MGLESRSPQSGNALRHSGRRPPFDWSLYWTPSQWPNSQATAADTNMGNVTQRCNEPRAWRVYEASAVPDKGRPAR